MMSTSDAAQCELSAETPHSGAAGARTAASRNHKYEHLRRENQRPISRQSFPSATTQEAAHTGLILSDVSVRSEDTPQQPVSPSFTSCLFLRLCSQPDLRANENPELSLHRLTRKADGGCCQNKGQTSESGSSARIFSSSSSSGGKLFTDRKNDDGISLNSKELETNRDYSSVSNKESGSGLYVVPRLKVLKSDTQTDPEERYKPPSTMLSSSVVTVLAPHWSSRLRRNRRFEGTSNPEALGSLQDVTKSATNCAHEWHQETADRSLTDRSQESLRVPFHGTWRNTEDWSTKSGPARLDYGCKRKMIHIVSLDVNSGRMDNRKIDAAASSALATTSSPQSPLSLQPHVQRRNQQTKNQDGLPSLSSKPTTSSLLLSLRRSSSRISNAASPLSEINTASSDQKGKLFPTRLSQTLHNKNDHDKLKPLQSPSSISCKTTETAPLLFSNQEERTLFETQFFSASPINRDAEDASFTQQAQTVTRAQSNLLCSKQAILSRGLPDRQQSFRGSDTNLFSESYGSSPRQSYDRSICLHPRRTTLTSTSWWKQVSQEGSSPLKLNDTGVKDKRNTPFAPPNNNNSDLASASPTDIKRCNRQIANNRDNNSTTESFCKGNMNLLMKPQGGSQSIKQRISEHSPEHDSDKLVKRQSESSVNNRGPQKPQSLPNVFLSSKINRATPQKTLSHPKDLGECDVSDSSFTATPSTVLNPKSLNSPPESTSKYKNNLTLTSPYNKDNQSLSNPLLSSSVTNTLNNQAPASKTASNLHPTNTTTNTVFNHLHTPSHTTSSSETSIFANPVNSKPLGFERSFNSVPFQPKAASRLIPTIKVFFKTEPSPAPASTSLSTMADNPAAPAFSRTSLLTPAPATPSIPITIPSPLTPPATPNITSPNSDSSSAQEGKDFSSSQRRDSKKLCSEEKRVRRVTWEDCVDQQHSEPIKNPELPQVSTSPLSSSRSSPTSNTYSLCSPTSRTSSIQALKGGKYRSFSSDSADLVSRVQDRSELGSNNPLIFDQKTQEEPRQERTLSVEPGTVLSSAPLSLPPDCLSGYKLRYSSPPYSTLMSTRSTTGETKTVTPRSLFQNPINYTPHLSKQTDSAVTSPMSKPPVSPGSLLQPPSTQQSSKLGVSETYQVNNKNSQGRQNSTILLVKNRVDIGSQSLQEAKAQTSSSTCVTETLVYCVQSKAVTEASKNSTSKLLQQAATTATENKFSQGPNKVQSKETAGEPGNLSEQSSSGSSSTDSRSTDDGSRKMKNSALCKSRFFSVESNNEQSPKRSRFALKKSVSTPNSSLSRAESDRTNKTYNRVDQVLSRLRQTFSTRRSDDELSFPWKWRRGSQTLSVGGLRDISSDVPAETKILEKPEQEEAKVLEDTEKETQSTKRWTHNRYSITTTTPSRGPLTAEKFDIWSDELPPEIDQDRQNACMEHVSEKKQKPLLTIHGPTTHMFNSYKDNRTTTQPLPCRDPSPGRSSNLSAGFSPQFRKSTPSPRSPFSPFSSLSPLSPFPSPEVTDDNVFYSPKLQRRGESPSPVDPREGISLRASRRSPAFTGPPSAGPGRDKDCSASYADLKYGIEPGRSFSVSSVLSSRPSGPGRISTGSRFKSVGDLSESALTSGGTETDPWSVSPDWTTGYDSLPSKDCLMAYFPSDPSKMKTRSLPRSLTRRLANWSSGISPSVTMATSKPARLRSPTLNTCHFSWDTEGPPTPPPTPPLSPVSRPMSKPPSLFSPNCPISTGLKKVDSPSSRGRLPSKGYVSSLSTFEESSDSSSDTTSDDEYYLETGENEKETEL
ncbi:mucin-2 [Labrus bergylta]|uniref:mucin-2 n=1 Tax=Labrus bergylta TaxID=56723 RepID=UPI003313C398